MRIEKLTGALESAKRHLQDNSILQELRDNEWSEYKSSLENTIAEQAQKINMLSVEIIERDIAAKKNAEKLANAEKLVENCSRNLEQTQNKL
jgi:uncharacterized coiled-coil protein SlyX